MVGLPLIFFAEFVADYIACGLDKTQSTINDIPDFMVKQKLAKVGACMHANMSYQSLVPCLCYILEMTNAITLLCTAEECT